MSAPPANVEVAVDDVAIKFAAFGVDEPTIDVPLNVKIELFESEPAFVPPFAIGSTLDTWLVSEIWPDMLA